MLDIDGTEWIFFVYQDNDGDPRIVESYDDPIKAAKLALELNKKGTDSFFLHGSPVIASIPVEEAVINGRTVWQKKV